MTSRQNLVLSMAVHCSYNGFTSGTWSYSTDGKNFTGLAQQQSGLVDLANNWGLRIADFRPVTAPQSCAIGDAARYTLAGANSSAAVLAIDNLGLIEGDPLPPPPPPDPTVIYDSTGITTNHTYGGRSTELCWHEAAAGEHVLLRCSTRRRFHLERAYVITSIRGDFITNAASFVGEGFTLKFSPMPAASLLKFRLAANYATLGDGLTIETFPETVFNFTGLSFIVDLSGQSIELSPGTWWVSMLCRG